MLPFLRALWLPLLVVFMVVLWIILEQSPVQRTASRGGRAADGGVTVLRWVVNSQERDQVFAQAARDQFEYLYPNIRIQLIKQNEGRKEDTMIAGGDAPDVILVGSDRVHYYVSAGVLRDLRPFMTASELADTADFFPVAMNAFQKNNRIFAMPWGYVPFILFYNKALFEQHAIPYPSDGWTWDDYRAAARALTQDLDGDGLTDQFGASFATWQDGYYCWIFQNGGRVLSPDGRRATFDSPEVVHAVEFVRRLTRVDRVMSTDVNRPKSGGGVDLFESGRLGINGPTGSFYIPTYRDYKKIDWDIAAVPSGPGGKGTLVAPFGFGVAAQSRHPREAYKLVQFLCGLEGQKLLADSGLFVPCRRSIAFSEAFLKAPGRPANKLALVSMMDDRNGKKPWGIVPPWSGNLWGDVNEEALNSKLNPFLFGIPKPGQTSEMICAEINARANQILNEDSVSHRGVPVDWRRVWLGAALSAAVVMGIWAAAVIRAGSGSRRRRAEQWWGYVAISPWLIGFLVFTVGPIVFSIILSFTRWSSLAPASQARFVGLDHYKTLLGGQDELFGTSLRATFWYVVLSLPIGLVTSLGLALLLNAKVKGIPFFRTLYYLPAVMPAVASAVLFRWMFTQNGLLNFLLGFGGAIPARTMPNWLNDPNWAVPAIVFMGLWGVGGGMMIYLAGLQSIPTQLYEAAQIDGAGAIAQFRAVTLPLLSPTIFFNLVMSIIGAFQVFTSAFVLFGGGPGPENAALFYSFYLYRKAFEQFQIGYGSALAWILFVIILLFTLIVFRTSIFWVYYDGQRDGSARDKRTPRAKSAEAAR